MIKINTTIPLKKLSGDVLKEENGTEFTIGKALGNILVGGKEQGKMKLYILGSKLYSESEVEVDESDFKLIKTVLKNTQIYGTLICGQIELELSKLEQESE